MRGLLSVKLHFEYHSVHTVGDFCSLRGKEHQERTARDFLLIIREELSHIKEITMVWNGWLGRKFEVENWMVHELKKRNEAWAAPLPRDKNFRRTFSPMSIVDSGIAKSVIRLEDRHKPKHHVESFTRLEKRYGVF